MKIDWRWMVMAAALAFGGGYLSGAVSAFEAYRRLPAWEVSPEPRKVIARLGQPTSVCGVWHAKVPLEPKYGAFSATRLENVAMVCEVRIRGEVHWISWERTP